MDLWEARKIAQHAYFAGAGIQDHTIFHFINIAGIKVTAAAGGGGDGAALVHFVCIHFSFLYSKDIVE